LQKCSLGREFSGGIFPRRNRARRVAVTQGMTTTNALGFMVLGLGMIFAPAEAPQLFPVNAGDGSCTSALWLELMGPLQFLLGLGVAARNEAIRLQAAIESWDPLGRVFDLAEVRWAMPASLYAATIHWAAEEMAAPYHGYFFEAAPIPDSEPALSLAG